MRTIRFILALLLALPAQQGWAAAPITTQAPLQVLISTCSSHAPIAGTGTGLSPACDTLSAMMDTAFGSARGDVIFRGAAGWTVLAPGTSGYALTTQGASADVIWAAASGGTGCTISGGAQYQIIVNNGSSACSSSANATVQVGALALGASGTLGSVAMGNATTGTVTLEPVTGALGTVVASLPANTGVIAETNLAQTWTAVQTITNSDLRLLGSSTGYTAFTSGNSSSSNYVATIPANTGTIAELNLAQTYTAAQTYTNSDLLLLGSSTGYTTFTSGNSSASNYTLTIPANTGTLAELNLAQTWTAAQTVTNSDLLLLGSSTGYTTFTSNNSSASNYTATFPANTGTIAELNFAQTWSAAQTFNSTDLVLAGSSSGGTTLNAAAVADTTTATLPDNTGIIAELNYAQTWSAVQTFTNSDIRLLGSSTGYTVLASANAGASNYTLTLPAVTDTVATLNTADQTMAGGVNLTAYSIGTVSSGTSTIDCGKGPAQYLTDGGAFTFAAPANDGSCLVMITNNGSAGAITFSGFSVPSNTGDTITTTNTAKFTISVWRINGTAGYRVAAMQ